MYPIGMHFGISQIVSAFALLLIQQHGKGMEVYYKNSIFLVGFSGLLTIFPVLCLYRRDRRGRIAGGLVSRYKPCGRSAGSYVLLFLMGAAMAQLGNLFMVFVQVFLESHTYQDAFSRISQGKSLLEMIYWMGIVAPVAEEAVFRWLICLRLRDYLRMPASIVISALLFGAYHGNISQFIYASILGCLFAYFMEMSGSLHAPVLLHIGANIWSLVYSELALWLLQTSAAWVIAGINLVCLLVFIWGFRYFKEIGKERREHLICSRCV